MIMDPGIDGLETYRRIIGLRPVVLMLFLVAMQFGFLRLTFREFIQELPLNFLFSAAGGKGSL